VGEVPYGVSRALCGNDAQATPLLAGLGVAVAAYGSRAALQAYHAFKAAPPRLRAFYKACAHPVLPKAHA